MEYTAFAANPTCVDTAPLVRNQLKPEKTSHTNGKNRKTEKQKTKKKLEVTIVSTGWTRKAIMQHLEQLEYGRQSHLLRNSYQLTRTLRSTLIILSSNYGYAKEEPGKLRDIHHPNVIPPTLR